MMRVRFYNRMFNVCMTVFDLDRSPSQLAAISAEHRLGRDIFVSIVVAGKPPPRQRTRQKNV